MLSLNEAVEYMTAKNFAEITIAKIKVLWPTIEYFELNNVDNKDLLLKSMRSRLTKAAHLDLNKLLYDMLSISDNMTLSLKYMLSVDVIEEVREGRFNKTHGIIPSKYYITAELAKLFKITPGVITDNKDITKLYQNKVCTSGTLFYFLGKDIIENIFDVARCYETQIQHNDTVYINHTEATKLLGVSMWYIENAIRTRGSVFGVNITDVLKVPTGSKKMIYYVESEILECVKNKKLYVLRSTLSNKRRMSSNSKRAASGALYLNGVDVSTLPTNYITKKLAIQILEMDEFFRVSTTAEFINYNITNLSRRPVREKINFNRLLAVMPENERGKIKGYSYRGVKMDFNKIKSTEELTVGQALKILKARKYK